MKKFIPLFIVAVLALVAMPSVSLGQDGGTKEINTTNYTLVQFTPYAFPARTDSAWLCFAVGDSVNARVLVQGKARVGTTDVYSDTVHVLIQDSAEYFATLAAGIKVIPWFKIKAAFSQMVPETIRVSLVCDATDTAYKSKVKAHQWWHEFQ